MEPASKIIAALGGNSKAARIAGVHRTRAWNWTRPRSVGGTGGIIPMRHVPNLIEAAKAEGITLAFEDFLPRSVTSEDAA